MALGEYPRDVIIPKNKPTLAPVFGLGPYNDLPPVAYHLYSKRPTRQAVYRMTRYVVIAGTCRLLNDNSEHGFSVYIHHYKQEFLTLVGRHAREPLRVFLKYENTLADDYGIWDRRWTPIWFTTMAEKEHGPDVALWLFYFHSKYIKQK